jgi:hypothetical protein
MLMALTSVWLRTLGDGLIRADQIVGVLAHPTPAGAGKPSHWLLDVVLPAGAGGGQADSWVVEPLHRTLIQTSTEPVDAGDHLVRLLAQLDTTNASGLITASAGPRPDSPARAGPATPASARAGDGEANLVRFRFTPFRATEPGRHYDPEYL